MALKVEYHGEQHWQGIQRDLDEQSPSAGAEQVAVPPRRADPTAYRGG
jgi:hypothetical protein